MTLALSARKGSGGRGRDQLKFTWERFGGGSAARLGWWGTALTEGSPLVSWTSTPTVPALRAIVCCAGRNTCHTLPYNTFPNHGRRSLRL